MSIHEILAELISFETKKLQVEGSRGHPTFDEYLKNNDVTIRSLASEYGLYEPNDYVNQFGDLIDAGDFEDEYDYLSAWEEKFEEIIKDRFKDLERRYERLPSKVILYRSVRLKELSKLDRNNLGVYWTDNYDSAQSYASHGRIGDDFIIKAEVPKADIDWDFSIKNNLNLFFGDGEQEINVKDNTNVKVLDVFDPDDKPTGTSFVGNVGKMGPWVFYRI